jgi:A/G-specific adenine glycosylase
MPPRVTTSGPRIRAALLKWFAAHRRDLPWRRTSDPYAVWVSEVMLQQTQVDRVVPFYERFLARFPRVELLAAAAPDEVLSHWSGLGYYSRARNLHAAAKAITGEHGGALPRTVAGLLALPGFGRYTAGAVASIAMGQPVPLVDGNVSRVFARLFTVEGAQGDRARDQLLWRIAEALVMGAAPGDFNQSLMELGATVCTPASPACRDCPVASWCGALAEDRVGELPAAKKPASRKRLALAVAFALRQGTVLLARRPPGGLFGGLWELPSADLAEGGGAALEALLGPGARVGALLAVISRTLTHRDLELHVHAVEMRPKLPGVLGAYVEWKWVEWAGLTGLGISSATEAALAQVRSRPEAP